MRVYPGLSEAVAEVIEILRKERKMTKTALADFAGIERCYLLDILNGKKKPTLNIIFSICDALHIHPNQFINLVTNKMNFPQV